MSDHFGPNWLSALTLCAVFVAACGAASDGNDTGEGTTTGGSTSNPGTAGRTGVAGGSFGSGGQQTGSGGFVGNHAAGMGGLVSGTGGAFTGGGFSSGGSNSSGGAQARGGAGGTSQAGQSFGGSGTGGHAGQSFGGSAGHAGQAAGGAGGMSATWTEIYTKFVSNAQYASNCNGAACHNPGKQRGYDFSSQASGYASVKNSTSQFVSVLSSGAMPQGKTKMPAADLAVVKAWVAAGAQNN